LALLISQPIKSTFIHIPKNAGSSISKWLRKNTTCQTTKRKQHALINDVIDGEHSLGKKTINDLGWTFCVVRNPWDWIVSFYTFEIMLSEYYIDTLIKEPHLQKIQKEKHNLEYHKTRLARLKKDGFAGFLNVAPSQLYVQNNQNTWARGCDHVMRYENLDTDFKLIQEKFGCNASLSVANKTTNRSNYKDYYTPETIKIVAEMYKEDINTFGYKFS
jgi:hypothetical protein|tara:strand:- start:39 stop:689 length:651 start_codon:yes stop_codon:yes gene_type:complete